MSQRKMRIGIDAHMLGDRSGGNESFYSGLLRAFDTRDGNDYILFMNPGVDDSPYRDRFKIVRFSSRTAIPRYFFELTKLCKKYRLDILHTQYYIPFIRPCKIVVTVHDICFEHYKNLFNKSEYIRNKLLVRYSVLKADKVITVSNFSKDDISNTYGVPDDKIEVINNAVDDGFRIMTEEELRAANVRGKFGIGNRPYIICVGNLQPRKNIPRLVEAFVKYNKENDTDLMMVIVGKKAWLYDESMKAVNSYSDSIISTGYVDKADLVALLNEAEAFVYPSFFEGFGIPPLEALVCGSKVAVSDIQVMHEVCGDYVTYFDPYDIDSIKDSIKTIVSRDYETKAFERNHLSWKIGAQRLKEVYAHIVDSQS